MKQNNRKICLLSFDIEEWFQVENMRSVISKEKWEQHDSTVLKNTEVILSLLSGFNIKSTFFILGCVAERTPDLVRMIHHEGHEVACHGYGHDMTINLSDEELRIDISRAKSVLEDITKDKIKGYRAPNFSVNDRLINVLLELGFIYDSSLNPFKLNPRYGSLNFKTDSSKKDIIRLPNGMYEIPISTSKIFGFNWPIGGGAYFRILPLWIFKKLTSNKFKYDNTHNFYLHPWEFEPFQPRQKDLRLDYKLRHYSGLSRTEKKLSNYIEFLLRKNCEFLTMSVYLKREDKT